jgi:ATP-binding cassette subfamily B (MDR/TAP) protein 1
MAFGMTSVSKDATDKAEAMVASRRVHELLIAESAIDPLAEMGSPPGSRLTTGRVELVDVNFAYPARPQAQIFRGLCLTVEAGQTVALVGPSGCGKSTVVGLLERFYDPDGGQVLLDGAELRTLSVRWLRSQIGLVSQEPVLFNGTIGENIALGKSDATKSEIEASARMANAYDFVTQFPDGFETAVGDKGVRLSGGQKQRIAIARAVVRDPAILILDEATSALDTASERIVQAALDELLRAKRRTTIVIAHRLSTIQGADKIAVISDGVVAEEGPHNVLMQREGGIYRALLKAQGVSAEDASGSSEGQ